MNKMGMKTAIFMLSCKLVFGGQVSERQLKILADSLYSRTKRSEQTAITVKTGGMIIKPAKEPRLFDIFGNIDPSSIGIDKKSGSILLKGEGWGQMDSLSHFEVPGDRVDGLRNQFQREVDRILPGVRIVNFQYKAHSRSRGLFGDFSEHQPFVKMTLDDIKQPQRKMPAKEKWAPYRPRSR
jgi:hypothetical protein